VTPGHDDRRDAVSPWWLGAQVLVALVLLMVGITMFLSGGRLLGAVLVGTGGAWAWRCINAL